MLLMLIKAPFNSILFYSILILATYDFQFVRRFFTQLQTVQAFTQCSDIRSLSDGISYQILLLTSVSVECLFPFIREL